MTLLKRRHNKQPYVTPMFDFSDIEVDPVMDGAVSVGAKGDDFKKDDDESDVLPEESKALRVVAFDDFEFVMPN